MNYFIKSNHPRGWECPRCNRVNAPWISACSCEPAQVTTGDTHVSIHADGNKDAGELADAFHDAWRKRLRR